MTFCPNRRFLRDCKQLINQGHLIEYIPSSKGYNFFLNGKKITIQHLGEVAKSWRRPYTQEEIDQAYKEADEILGKINWNS